MARVCRQFLDDEGTGTIDWPSCSPVAQSHTVQELADALIQVWEEIDCCYIILFSTDYTMYISKDFQLEQVIH